MEEPKTKEIPIKTNDPNESQSDKDNKKDCLKINENHAHIAPNHVFNEPTVKPRKSPGRCTMCYKGIQCTSHKKSNKKFQCDVCGEWFKHTYTLRKHKSNHEGKHVCTICNKRYGLPSSLKRHMEVHSKNKKVYNCQYCDKPLCSVSSLSAHERLNTLEKPFKCDICNKTFVQSSNLKTHQLVHSDFKPYVCELCTNPFRHKQSLLVHLRSHTKERPFTCETCGKTFSQNTHMRTHERLHSGIKPYKCFVCEKTFSRKHLLDYHMEMHSGKTYRCSICDIGLQQKEQLSNMREYIPGKPHINVTYAARNSNIMVF